MTKIWPDISDMPDPNDNIRSQYRALRCKPEEIAPNVIVPGDPMRAKRHSIDWRLYKHLLVTKLYHESKTNEHDE